MLFYTSAVRPYKEINILFNDTINTFYFTVLWHRTYGKGPFRWRERIPAAGILFPISSIRSHRQDSTYHGLWYGSRGALAGTQNSSVGPPGLISVSDTTHTVNIISCWINV